MKLLIVDDNPINRKFLFYSLKKHYEIETANHGLEAVEMTEQIEFDIILMDLCMPVMDGAEATGRIRNSKQFRNKHIPIIFVTTNDFEQDRLRCMAMGGDDYIIKPVDITNLLSSINYHLGVKQPQMMQNYL